MGNIVHNGVCTLIAELNPWFILTIYGVMTTKSTLEKSLICPYDLPISNYIYNSSFIELSATSKRILIQKTFTVG